MPVKKNLQERLLARLGYQYQNSQLFQKALTHRSAKNAHNERMEFLGDSILGAIISEALFDKFPTADEGQLSRLRSSLVRGKTLAVIAKEIELGDCLYLGEGEMKSGGHRRESILADAFEALLGSIYLDSNFEQTKKVTLSLYQERLKNLTLQSVEKDPKTRLQEFLQSKKYELPIYDLVEAKGEAHEQTFTVTCSVTISNKDKKQKLQAKASSNSRRSAEQKAAHDILEQLRKLK